MATITLPTLRIKSLRAIKRSSSKMSMSPLNFTQQVFGYKGTLRVVEIELPTMSATDAATWGAFFEDLEGYVNTFNMDLTKAFPNESGLTSVAMRLTTPDVGWEADVAQTYGFSFTAMEAK